MSEGPAKDIQSALERVKAQVRARVAHPFRLTKHVFRHRKTRRKGLAKNAAQLFSLFGLTDLVIAKRKLMTLDSYKTDAPVLGRIGRLNRLAGLQCCASRN